MSHKMSYNFFIHHRHIRRHRKPGHVRLEGKRTQYPIQRTLHIKPIHQSIKLPWYIRFLFTGNKHPLTKLSKYLIEILPLRPAMIIDPALIKPHP